MVQMKITDNWTEIIEDEEISTIEQKIVEDGKNVVKVISSKGNLYNVKKSDIVKMTKICRTGDTAVIKTFPKGWLVVDVIPKKVDIEINIDLEKELQSFNNLCGGY